MKTDLDDIREITVHFTNGSIDDTTFSYLNDQLVDDGGSELFSTDGEEQAIIEYCERNELGEVDYIEGMD